MKPRERIREAVKQVEIASEETERPWPELDEAAIRLRGVADRLDEEAMQEMVAGLEEHPDGTDNVTAKIDEAGERP